MQSKTLKILKTLTADFKIKQASFSASKASHAEDQDSERLKSEIQAMALTGKQVSERHKTDRMAYNQSLEHIKELRERAENLFQELFIQVHRRTINNCFECQDTGQAYAFSDESEQCFPCQSPLRRRCQGSLDDEDTDRMRVALENLDDQIDQRLSCESLQPDQYQSLKAQLVQAKEVMASYRQHPDPTPQQCADYARRHSLLERAKKELDDFRNQSMIDDPTYQELRIRRRLVDECHFELLRRGVFYYEELEELAGHPERRGHKAAEHMDHDEFRAAVECAAEHHEEWTQSPLPTTTLSEGTNDDDAWDSQQRLLHLFVSCDFRVLIVTFFGYLQHGSSVI